MIFGIDKDSVVRAGGHTRFTPNADRFVEIDDAIRAIKHRCGWAGGYTRSVRTLVAACHLVRPPHLRKNPHVNMLNVGSRHRKWHHILGLTRSCTSVTTNASSVVDYFRPLYGLSFFWH